MSWGDRTVWLGSRGRQSQGSGLLRPGIPAQNRGTRGESGAGREAMAPPKNSSEQTSPQPRLARKQPFLIVEKRQHCKACCLSVGSKAESYRHSSKAGERNQSSRRLCGRQAGSRRWNSGLTRSRRMPSAPALQPPLRAAHPHLQSQTAPRGDDGGHATALLQRRWMAGARAWFLSRGCLILRDSGQSISQIPP